MKKLIVSISTVVILLSMFIIANTAYSADRISIATVELSQSNYTYTGKKIVPQFTVYDANGNVVKAGEGNFYYNTSDNVNPGTASIKITGTNNYKSSVTVTYKIKPASIDSAKVEPISVVYGKTPSLKFKFNNKKLVYGIDYTYSVNAASKAGQYTVYEITGKGNFSGTRTLRKITHPRKLTGLKASNRTYDGFKLKWNSQSKDGVTNYKVYKCDPNGENRKLVADTSNTSTTISGYSAGDYAYIIAKSYVVVDGTRYYGDYSKVYKTVSKPEKALNSNCIKSKSGKKLNLYWEKAECTGYQVQYARNKNFKKGVKTVDISGSSKTSTSVKIKKSNKTFYSRVRVYRQYKYNGKTYKYYGPWSKVLSSNYSKIFEFYKTPYPYNPNRTTNLKLACKAINGTILQPGETFSFNATVGQRTSSKGYKPATIFTGGTGTAQGLGGGVCQVASTLFNAALYSNFSIVERHQHSQRVSYCPLGRDAAIYWGSEDLKFKNNYSFPVKVEMYLKDGYVHANIRVSCDVNAPKVKLDVTRSGNHFTLRRYVNGNCNYSTGSTY